MLFGKYFDWEFLVVFVGYSVFNVFNDCWDRVVIIFELFGIGLYWDVGMFVDVFVIGVVICVLKVVLVIDVIDWDCGEIGCVGLYVVNELFCVLWYWDWNCFFCCVGRFVWFGSYFVWCICGWFGVGLWLNVVDGLLIFECIWL